MKKLTGSIICILSSIVCMSSVNALDNTLEITCDNKKLYKKNDTVTCTIQGSVSSGNISSFEMNYSAPGMTLKECTGLNGVALSCNSNTIAGSFSEPNIDNVALGTISFVVNEADNKNLTFTNKSIASRINKTNNSNLTFIGDSYFDWMDGINSLYNINYNDGIDTPDLMNVSMYGKGGYRIEQMTALIEEGSSLITINENTTDVVLYLGTNNIWQKQTPESARDYMIELIELINNKKSNVRIHILKLFPFLPSYAAKVDVLNNYYEQMTNTYSNVSLIDTRQGILDENGALSENYNGHLTTEQYPVWVSNIIKAFSLDYAFNTYGVNSNTNISVKVQSDDSTVKNIKINDEIANVNNNIVNHSVNYNNTTVTIGATLSNGNATYVKGYGPRKVTLKEGSNEFLLKVISEDGSATSTYTINITRESKSLSNDSSLKEVKINDKKITFNSELIYNQVVTYDVSEIVVNSVLSDKNAKYVEGYGPRKVTLKEGKNEILLKVTSESGKSISTYTINITRESKPLSNDSSLKEVTINNQKIIFSSEAIYNQVVAYDVSEIVVNSVLSDKNAKYVEGYGPRKVTLDVGNNEVLLKVVSEDGKSTSTYTINIEREKEKEALSDEASLSEIKVDGEKILINSQDKIYSIKVLNEIDKVEIEATLTSDKASFVDEYKPGTYNLIEGENQIILKVLSEDGKNTNEYIINIERALPEEEVIISPVEEDKTIENKVENPNTNVGFIAITVVVFIASISFGIFIYLKKKNHFSKV